MRFSSLILWAVLAFSVSAFTPAQSVLTDAGAGFGGVHRVELDDIKVQWFSSDEEDLPAWISGRVDVGPFGGLEGRLIETGLAGDGTDDDGDPLGFDTKVFETRDGSLTALAFGRGILDFTTVYRDRDAGGAVYHLRRYGAPGSWVLRVAQRGKDGDYVGRNRFPLLGTVKGGVLTITTAPVGDNDSENAL